MDEPVENGAKIKASVAWLSEGERDAFGSSDIDVTQCGR